MPDLRTEHKAKDRIRIFEQILSDSEVQAVGTSDVNILAHFKNTKYGAKLVDERNYDKQHGTNHVNHAHITLSKESGIKYVRMKAPNGEIVNVPKGMEKQAIAHGGVRI